MREILEVIQKSAIRIKDAIDIKDIGYSVSENSSGETQLQLDIQCDMIIEEEFSKVPTIGTIASEEKDQAVELGSGKYLIAYDPLDGSSLVDVNLSVGSIFGIYEHSFSSSELIASCYVVYGPRVELVFAYQGKVKLYLLQEGEFEYVKEIRLNNRGNLNAPGGTQQNWEPYHKELIDSFFNEGYRLRYSGGMVPDLHQILLKGGGLFSYPATSDKPEGKLRMLFEVFPFAMIFDMAGGEAINGKIDVLTIAPRHVHDTTPCFFGSKYEINRVKEVYGAQ
ncbi:MAG: class 1 fructose-bisphosphatase [Campylobacterota bacterium]|nr:class 1 fructose-bisphosphatase [Campylobacterota bacterium]